MADDLDSRNDQGLSTRAPSATTNRASARRFFDRRLRSVARRTDRFLALALIAQWLAVLGLGPVSSAPEAAATALPVAVAAGLARTSPGRTRTRYAIVAAQFVLSVPLSSAMPAHGLISLALAAAYLDPPVLLAAAVAAFATRLPFGCSVEEALRIAAAFAVLAGLQRVARREILAGAARRAVLERRLARAEAADKAKSELLAYVGHEIRTPLNAVVGLTELALAGPLDREPRDYLETVASSADGLLTIADDLLDFARIEAGKLRLNPVEFGLRECVDGTLDILRIQARRKGLDLTREIPPDVPERLVGDPVRLRQILLNLVGNAIKFTPKGKVAVLVERVSIVGDTVVPRFAVRDTGIGIPRDRQAIVWEPFEQGDDSIPLRHGGAGLGLTITSRLVALMGGRIRLESEPGAGGTFRFTAEFRAAAAPVATEPVPLPLPPPAPSSLEPTGRPLSVLVAEDNRVNRMLVLRLLEKRGHSVALVGNGRELLDALDADPDAFDLILMDVRMPGLDGMETVARLKANPRFERVPAVAITARALPGDREECLAAGFDGYLAKPLRPELLFREIERLARPRRPSAVDLGSSESFRYHPAAPDPTESLPCRARSPVVSPSSSSPSRPWGSPSAVEAPRA